MRYFIGVLVIIFILVVGTVLFIGRDREEGVDLSPAATKTVDSIDQTGSRAVWTMQGGTVGDDERRAVRITVSASERKIELLEGYRETVGKSRTYPNNKDGYRVFMKALDNLGYGDTRQDVTADPEGFCPEGKRYLYAISNGTENTHSSWSTSCSRREGNFDGDPVDVRQLFQEQISDYNDFVRKVKF